MLVVPAQGAVRDPQLDSLGRVVRDANGTRHTYPSDGPTAGLVNKSAVASPTRLKAATAPVQKTRSGTAVMNAASLPDFRENWRFNNWGWGIGYDGFWPVDIDANGDKELIYGLGNAQWAIADYFPATHDYRVVWKSPQMSVSAMRVVELGNTKTVWIGGNSDGVRVYDAITQNLLATMPIQAGLYVVDFALGDADNDGSLDLIALTPDRLLLYDPVTFALKNTLLLGANASESSFAVGNVDNDADTEIALTDGRVVRFNGTTLTVEWDKGSPFGSRIRMADIDGDGRDEVISSLGWGSIQSWDVETKSLKWDHATPIDVAAIRTFDVTGDGIPEVIYGDGQWGAIHAINTSTNGELWTINNPEHGVTDITICDIDGDGQLEVIWGAGATSSGPDYMYVADIATRTIEWQSFDISSMFSAIGVGDLDNDGHNELVFISTQSESGYADGVLQIVDAETHQLEYRSGDNLFGGYAWTGSTP